MPVSQCLLTPFRQERFHFGFLPVFAHFPQNQIWHKGTYFFSNRQTNKRFLPMRYEMAGARSGKWCNGVTCNGAFLILYIFIGQRGIYYNRYRKVALHRYTTMPKEQGRRCYYNLRNVSSRGVKRVVICPCLLGVLSEFSREYVYICVL